MTKPATPAAFNLELTPGNVKAAMRSAGAPSADLWKVPLGHIRVMEGFNVRVTDDPEYQAHVRRIADSIKVEGFYDHKPLAGYVSREGDINFINITDGHTRLAAVAIANAEGAEIASLPVVVSPRGTNLEDLTVALVTGNSGRQLTPYEVGIVCKRLLGYGMPEKRISERLGVTVRWIRDLLSLVAAPSTVRGLVVAGAVSPTLAIDTIKSHGDKAADRLTRGVANAKAAGTDRVTKKHLQPDTASMQNAADRQALQRHVVIQARAVVDTWNRYPAGVKTEFFEHNAMLSFNLDALAAAFGRIGVQEDRDE
jgi:ParB family chromosome partitioning protein